MYQYDSKSEIQTIPTFLWPKNKGQENTSHWWIHDHSDQLTWYCCSNAYQPLEEMMKTHTYWLVCGLKPGWLANDYKCWNRKWSNSALLEMAVADFFHCKNLPDRVVESNRFFKILDIAKTVGSGFTIPSGEKIRGEFLFTQSFVTYELTTLFNSYTCELLNLNFENTYHYNRIAIMDQASTFGLGWLSDGAIIWHMPLLNMMVTCDGARPVVTSTWDCTDHMSEGEKKDVVDITGIFQEKVNKSIPDGRKTNIFIFDSTSNDQKAGQILWETFPSAYCVHGGKHPCPSSSVIYINWSQSR